MRFSSLAEFDREFKGLKKRYRSLDDDLANLKIILKKYPRGFEPRIFRISGLGVVSEIYKVKHFHCKAMKNKGARSGIRIIYAYCPEEEEIKLVEIYYKEKDNRDCDKQRILRYFK